MNNFVQERWTKIFYLKLETKKNVNKFKNKTKSQINSETERKLFRINKENDNIYLDVLQRLLKFVSQLKKILRFLNWMFDEMRKVHLRLTAASPFLPSPTTACILLAFFTFAINCKQFFFLFKYFNNIS